MASSNLGEQSDAAVRRLEFIHNHRAIAGTSPKYYNIMDGGV